jgi:phage shock protein PspC (stress-responsive transcriptional regulator)
VEILEKMLQINGMTFLVFFESIFMEYLLFIIAILVAYPVFMVIAFVLSKVIFPKEEEFKELEEKQRLARQQQRSNRSLAHA